ncbi:MAG TPA: cytochrome c oxidase subunit II [bacterium]
MMPPGETDRAATRTAARNLSLGILLMVVVGGVGSFLIARARWWLPPEASTQAVEIDRLFYTTLAVTGIAFVLVHVLLALFVWQGGRRERAEHFAEHNTLELTYTLVPTAILVTLIAMGSVVWARVHQPAPADALLVEVRAEQFGWLFRYPGADGAFGRYEARLINTRTNPIGLDPADPAGRDDIVVRELHLVANRTVHVRLRSKDVIHSFFIPTFRVKQDAVPGMILNVVFTPNRAGHYEIACAELCGVGHYIMRGKITVEPQQAFDSWLASQAPAAP